MLLLKENAANLLFFNFQIQKGSQCMFLNNTLANYSALQKGILYGKISTLQLWLLLTGTRAV